MDWLPGIKRRRALGKETPGDWDWLIARVAELERERDDKGETIDWLSDMLRTVNELHRAEFQAREKAEAERAAAVKRGDWVQGEPTECKGKLAHTRDWKTLAESFESERNIAQHDLAVARARIAELERERDAWKEAFDDELEGRQVLRGQYGAYETELFPQFIERLAAERDAARRELEEMRGRVKAALGSIKEAELSHQKYGGHMSMKILDAKKLLAAIEPGGE